MGVKVLRENKEEKNNKNMITFRGQKKFGCQ